MTNESCPSSSPDSPVAHYGDPNSAKVAFDPFIYMSTGIGLLDAGRC